MKSVSMLAVASMLIIGAASSQLLAEETGSPWHKIKEEKSLVVYSRDIEGSDTIMVKAEVVINANLQTILSILDDVPNRKKWIPHLLEARVLADYSADEKLEYSYFSAPWPASDRDFVYHKQMLHQDDEKIVFVMHTVENELMPEQDWVVRAELIESQYTLTKLTDEKTKAELTFQADLKGWLPGWIVNKIQELMPYITLRNLKMTAENN